MSEAPERIFLQDAGDYARAAAFEVTWCVEPQDDADTEYIRADKVQALVEAAKEVGRISDRDHVAWRRLASALAALDAKP
jgi:hypothetical protein